MAISLGREYTLKIDGITVTGTRDVTINETATELSFQPFGSRSIFSYTTGYSIDISFECIDSGWFVDGLVLLESGEHTPVQIIDSGLNSVWSFNAVVTSIAETQPLDGVRAVQTTLKRYFYDDGDPLRVGDTNP